MKNLKVCSKASISSAIRSKVMGFKAGHLFRCDDLKIAGSRATILRCLSKMIKQGELRRAYRGIYYKPRMSTILKGRELPPDIYGTLRIITRATNEKIFVHGGFAANKLGLSKHIPMQLGYYTNRKSRQISIGKVKVRLVHTDLKALFDTTQPAIAMAIAALIFLGEELVDERVIERIKLNLTTEEFQNLQKLALKDWMLLALNKNTVLPKQ